MATITFTPKHLDALRAEYASLDRAPVSVLPKFHALFTKLDGIALTQLFDARIKFVSGLALNELIRRGLK